MQILDLELVLRVEFGKFSLKVIDDNGIDKVRCHVWNEAYGELA